jgi:hypothetical protein
LLTGYINHSGGAIGSDSIWGMVGKQFGVESRHYYIDKITPRGNTEITNTADIRTAQIKASAASEQLKRGKWASLSQNVKNLIMRNWFQVVNADAIFAIGTIKRVYDKETGRQS